MKCLFLLRGILKVLARALSEYVWVNVKVCLSTNSLMLAYIAETEKRE